MNNYREPRTDFKPNISAADACIFSKLLVGQTLNGELAVLSPKFRGICQKLNGLPLTDRQRAMEEFLADQPGRDEIVMAIANAAPDGPMPPEGKSSLETATLADFDSFEAGGHFIWEGWLVRRHLNLLTSDPKVGKTCLAMDLSRRIYSGDEWPDGSPATFEAGTKTLWICGDMHQSELKVRATACGLPWDAVLLNAFKGNRSDGCTIDDPRQMDELRGRVERYRPALVIVDTLWRATDHRMHREDEINRAVGPLISIAQDCDVTILALTHLSLQNETLGRRLDGTARSILKLEQPDSDNPARRRLSVKGNHKEPPALGMVITDTGCEFDSQPPEKLSGGGPGRPATKGPEAEQFLGNYLADRPRSRSDAIRAWEEKGGKRGTLVAAATRMEKAGRLSIDSADGEHVWSLPTSDTTEPDPTDDIPF